jgi:glutathione synthase/RimK-type ligase-like ATP-grasp enzyme
MLAEGFRSVGFQVFTPAWDDPSQNWKAYDFIIIKSTWNYFDFPVNWYKWLELLNHLRIPTLNSLKTIKWNSDKIYLQDILCQDLQVIQSEWVEDPAALTINIFEKFASDEIVIKPRIGGGAKDTFRITRKEFSEKKTNLKELLRSSNMLIQPFMRQISTSGEYSFIFIGGELSHVVLKKPKKGEFRVQHLFGGTIERAWVSEAYVAQATAFVDKFAPSCLHARVDMIDVDGRLFLMELELIEPYLFLYLTKTGVGKYVKAFEELMKPWVPKLPKSLQSSMY